jgi:hypothetical protein
MKCVEKDFGELDLTAQMKERIEQHAGGHFHGLRVRQIGRKVVLSGHTSSYHILQLALAAAWELAASMTLEIHVDVRPTPVLTPIASSGHDSAS